MKKLHSIAFYALLAPVITLSSTAALSQQAAGQDADREQGGSQPHRGSTLVTDQDLDHEQRRTQTNPSTTRSTPLTTRSNESTDRGGSSDSRTASDRSGMRDNDSRMESRGFMDSAPTGGMRVSELLGADVATSGEEDVGSVDDLIIDENGRIVAIIVGVGGFLGMGQKEVAIGWDDVTKTADSDDVELRIDITREGLRSAPEFETEEE